MYSLSVDNSLYLRVSRMSVTVQTMATQLWNKKSWSGRLNKIWSVVTNQPSVSSAAYRSRSRFWGQNINSVAVVYPDGWISSLYHRNRAWYQRPVIQNDWKKKTSRKWLLPVPVWATIIIASGLLWIRLVQRTFGSNSLLWISNRWNTKIAFFFLFNFRLNWYYSKYRKAMLWRAMQKQFENLFRLG